MSRAVGETMAVVLAAGMRPQITLNPLTSIETMTTYIVQVIGGDASFGEPKYLSLFAVGLTLFAITLTLNIISGWSCGTFARSINESRRTSPVPSQPPDAAGAGADLRRGLPGGHLHGSRGARPAPGLGRGRGAPGAARSPVVRGRAQLAELLALVRPAGRAAAVAQGQALGRATGSGSSAACGCWAWSR